MIIAKQQYTIIDMSDPIISGVAPLSPAKDTLWLDISVTPNVLKRWDGSKWVVVNDTTGIENNLNQLQTDFKVEQGKISTLIKDTTIDGVKLKDKYLELNATVDGFNGTISDIKTSVDQTTGKVTALESKVTKVEATANGLKTEVSQANSNASAAKTLAEQTANKFSWIVKSGTSEANFELTDRVATLVANNINLKGLVTFSGLGQDAKDKISNAEKKANDANTKVDNLEIGGRNLIKNSDFTNDFNGWHCSGDVTYSFSNDDTFKNYVKVTTTAGYEPDRIYTDTNENFKHIMDEQYTISFWAKSNANIVLHTANGGTRNLQSYSLTTTWTYFTRTYVAIGNNGSLSFFLDKAASFDLANVKMELGNKPTDWTPSPEDKANQQIIDDWTTDSFGSSQSNVTTINGNFIKTGTINADKINIDDLIVDNGALMNKINAQEIDTKRLVGEAIHADLLSLYNMRVLNKDKNKETFTIDNIGNVTLRGDMESFDYVSGKSGWSIRNDGYAEFNDITVRGSVITNDGGIVYGGGVGRNLAKETNFGSNNWLWLMQAGDYKKEDYIENGINGVKFTRGNEAQTGRSVIFYSNICAEKFKPSTQYIVSFEVLSDTKYDFGVSIKQSNLLNPIANEVRSNEVVPNEWTKITAVLTTETSLPSTIYGQGLLLRGMPSTLGKVHCFRNLKIEEGSVATPWSPAPEDKLKQVRFWAGSSYEQRENAPFKVYSDGSVAATKGTYSGVWTGDIRVGNISIVDPSTSSGNDANFTIQNGQNGIKKVQLSDGSSSIFAQDLIISTNAYSPSITLKQDGSAKFNTGISIGSNTSLSGGRLVLGGQTLDGTSSGFTFNSTSVNIGNAQVGSNLNVYGGANVNGELRLNNVLYFGNVIKVTTLPNGINIDYIGS